MQHGDFALAPEPLFLMPKTWAHKYTRYTVPQFILQT